MDGVVGGDLLYWLAAIDADRLHGVSGIELGAVGAALAHRWEPTFRGAGQPVRLAMGFVQKSQSTSSYEEAPKPTLASKGACLVKQSL